MESFQFMEFPSDQISYDIEDPDQSGESLSEAKSTLDVENVELPLPPGTTGDEFFASLGYKVETLQTLSLAQTVSNEGKSKSESSELSNFTYGPQLPSNYKNILENQNLNKNDSESTTNNGDKTSDYFNDSRYSPSKVDSDEENQDVASKPKVLGKEQAKKRLMAFSVAKQSANSAKKQNKTTPAKKEKPPNPNKGTNFQDQFRATISAIEEEKKKIYQNMPDYMLQEMNELVKGHIVSSPNLKSSDKKVRDHRKKDKSVRYDSASKKRNERSRGSRRSRSRCSSRRRRRGRRSRTRSRSRSKSNIGYNKRKKRSWSRSRRSRSAGKKSMENKQVKSEQTKPGKNEKDNVPRKEVFEDWKSLKNSAAETGSDSVFLKNELHKSENQEPEPVSMPQGCQSHFKPIFNYLNKGYHKMTPLRAKRVDPNNGKLALFPEKTIKFTRTKPVIIWTENPSLATDYFMPMEVLLENCPSGFEPILRFIIEGKNSELINDNLPLSSAKSRQWYSREKYLRVFSPNEVDKTETVVQSSPVENQLKEAVTQPSENKISLVNEDYLSDEMEQEEITVGNIKLQLDMEMNTVKVRSKWDSDFEEGNNEKESSANQSQSKEVHGTPKNINSEEKLEEFLIEPMRESSEEKLQLLTKSPSGKNTDSHPGYLASEYEEFLKMVSFDPKDTQDSQTENITQYDNVKCESTRKTEKAVRDNDKNLKPSIDWDNESEQEEEFKILPEKSQTGGKSLKSEKPKKKKSKIEKLKVKKKKVKKPSKVKVDKCPHSDDSSTSGSESDSDSDSESDSSREMKKKKNDSKRKKQLKEKKKSKRYLSDKSETDSDGGKPKKKKGKKKGESSDSEESQRKSLKQIDLKKQLIIKKVEEIDRGTEKIDKKKGRENEFRKDCSENVKGLKSGEKKSKNKSTKKIKQKKIKNSDTESDSISSRESIEKKAKKRMSKKHVPSETSDSDEDTKPIKTKSSKYKKTKKQKKRKGKKYSSSSESEEIISTKKWKKKKKDVNPSKQLTSSIPLVETELKMEGKMNERSSKTLKKKEKKDKKEEDEWETSSSSAELEDESESSWDEEVKAVVKGPEIDIPKEKQDDDVLPKKEETEKSLVSQVSENLLSGSETLKNSMSNFSFNESSFCGFEQELSRDFFLTERSFSSSANIGTCESTGLAPIEARPFQCIGKSEEKKTVSSELYSPGCSDSESSDTVPKSAKSNSASPAKDVYDPLNCESEGSGSGDNEAEISTIPLPTAADISLSLDQKSQNVPMSPVLKGNDELDKALLSNNPPLKFIANEFSLTSNAPLNENSPKKQIMNFKNQQTLKTKAASLFQGDSDEENKEPKKSREEKPIKTDIETDEKKKLEKETRDGIKERERKRSRSREREGKKSSSKTPEASKREIRSDSFEIEPLKSVADELVESVQPIPVLLGVSSNRTWSGSLPGYEFSQVSDNLVDEAESFDIYPSEETKYPSENYTYDLSVEKVTEKLGKRRKSRSKSLSPRKKRKSKSPVRRRSPKRWSISPKHRDKSSRSPRRRSPKRKSPSRRRSGSPCRRRKSRRLSSPRRSRSKSPPKRRSPKRWDSSPRRKDSPPRGYSPRRDSHYPSYSDHPFWVPSAGIAEKDDMEVSPPDGCSPQYNSSMAFPPRMTGPNVVEAEINNSFYEGEYANEYGVNSYREEIGMNNLITIKNHSVEKMDSPKRPSLDQRIELELGSPISSNSSQFPNTSQPPQPFEGIEPNHYSAYNCDNSGANENFYPNQGLPDFNGQYFNEVQPSNYASYPYPHTHPPPQSQPPSSQNAVMQVGNIVEVVPALQHSLRPPPPPKTPQIMQVGNVLQVVPTQKVSTPAPVPPPVLDHESLPSSPVVKTQKATAVVAPSSVVPPPNLEAMMNPLIKAILLEREKRRKAKEKRRLEREARRKARQLRREAKLMSVSEKLKKSVQNEGLVLGQEVEDDELLDAMDIPSPPVPVQIITVSSPSAASPAAKGILITAGFVSKSPSKKKEVKFADGVFPGEGTSSSGEEDIPLSPPKPKLPKEKPFKKKKIKVKKKVKVHIIKQILHEEEDDEDDDILSPPPPPPGDPPPVFFARFPFAGNAQFPVYQTQTTPVTSVQYPAQAI